MDYLSISAMALSLANAIVVVIHELHIKRCQSIFCSSDCTKSEPTTPIKKNYKETIVDSPNYQSISHC